MSENQRFIVKGEPIRVLIADNQPLTTAGLTQFLNERDDIGELDYVYHKENFHNILTEFKPTLLIADYNMDGYITIEDLKEGIKAVPATHTLIVSSDDSKKNILEVVQLGIKGYLTKDCSKDEVMMAIQSTSKGEKFFCHKILDIIMEKSFSNDPEVLESGVLTVRETEVLGLIASGMSSQQVADKLFLSPHTIHTHRKSIIKKLNIKSPTEFVIHAMDLGILKPR